MVLEVILVCTVVSAIASVVNLFEGKKKPLEDGTIPMEVQLPGNLPVIALSSNGNVFNFIVDSGSNISHICTEYFEGLDAVLLGEYKDGTVDGLGATNVGIVMCTANLHDVTGNEYKVHLSISNQLSSVARSIEVNTGVKIHGLLGTDFLNTYNCVLDFKALAVYPSK